MTTIDEQDEKSAEVARLRRIEAAARAVVDAVIHGSSLKVDDAIDDLESALEEGE